MNAITGQHPKRKGITLASYTGNSQDLLALAVMAESQGYEDVWFADVGSPDALTLAAAVAVRTKRVRIGVAVTPIYTRTPPVLAASANTLQELSAERFILGLGTSSHTMVENWHGLSFAKPVKRMRETVLLLREIFEGTKTDFQGETLSSHGYRQKSMHIPLYIAALRPKMLETAAEIGDGVVLNLYPRPALANIIRHIKIGAAHAKKDFLPEIVCRHQVLVCDDSKEAMPPLRAFLSSYFATKVYNDYLAWCGYPEIAAELLDAWNKKDKQRSHNAMSDDLIHELTIVGNEGYCREHLRNSAAAGIDTHIISCLSPDAKIQARTYNFCAGVNLM